MKTLLILVLALLPLTLNADQPLPEGDQHVAMLERELDDVLSASILLKRCFDEERSNAEVVNAANVLADNYERLCAHLTQFYVWIKYPSKTPDKSSEELSSAAKEHLRDLCDRVNTVATSSFQDLADSSNKHPQYNHDLAAVAQRITSATKAMETLKARADGKSR